MDVWAIMMKKFKLKMIDIGPLTRSAELMLISSQNLITFMIRTRSLVLLLFFSEYFFSCSII